MVGAFFVWISKSVVLGTCEKHKSSQASSYTEGSWTCWACSSLLTALQGMPALPAACLGHPRVQEIPFPDAPTFGEQSALPDCRAPVPRGVLVFGGRQHSLSRLAFHLPRRGARFPVAKTRRSQRRGPRFNPWSGN